MRKVILPASAWVLMRGKFQVHELVPGDLVQAYDYDTRRPVMGRIATVTPVEQVQKVLAPVFRYRVVPFGKTTVALTPQGERSLEQGARQLIGYCNQNPTKLLIRTVDTLIEYDEMIDAVELTWEWPKYIWAEGILVGTACET